MTVDRNWRKIRGWLVSIYQKIPLPSGTPRALGVLGILGWILLLWRLVPGTPVEAIKETLRERDDRLHGEIWDIHYCMGDSGWSEAEFSYPEPTLVLGMDRACSYQVTNCLAVAEERLQTR